MLPPCAPLDAAGGNLGLFRVPMSDSQGNPTNLVCGAGVNSDGSMAPRMAINGWDYGQYCSNWPGVDAAERDGQVIHTVGNMYSNSSRVQIMLG